MFKAMLSEVACFIHPHKVKNIEMDGEVAIKKRFVQLQYIFVLIFSSISYLY